jgi:hypothetical protein
LNNGSVFWHIPNVDAVFYESREDLLALINQSQESASSDNIMNKLLPQGENFIETVPQLIAQLAVKLDIAREELDNSEQSLYKIDEAAQQLLESEVLEEEIYAPLVAYVGEFIRQQTDGNWEMRLNQSGTEKFWEAWIVRSDGSYCSPSIPILNFLYERNFSLIDEVYNALELNYSFSHHQDIYPDEAVVVDGDVNI